MRLTSTQRWVTVSLAVLFAFLSLAAASADQWAWYMVAAVFLAIAFLAVNLPPATEEVLPRATEVGVRGELFEVAVAFVGEPALVFDRLLGAGWRIGGHGNCGPGRDHDGFAALEVSAGDSEAARRAAGRAVQQAGARQVMEIGEARRLR